MYIIAVGLTCGGENKCHYPEIQSRVLRLIRIPIVLGQRENERSRPALPDTNELLVEDHPGQKVDKGGVGGEDGGDHRAVQVLQGGDVEIIGED